MKVILRKNKTDNEMIDIVTNDYTGNGEILWTVIHSDFIRGETGMGVLVNELMERDGEITVNIKYAE